MIQSVLLQVLSGMHDECFKITLRNDGREIEQMLMDKIHELREEINKQVVSNNADKKKSFTLKYKNYSKYDRILIIANGRREGNVEKCR